MESNVELGEAEDGQRCDACLESLLRPLNKRMSRESARKRSGFTMVVL
jgi:hypothetical protein